MEKFNTLTGIAVPLLRPNIDTDTIIPAQFLVSLDKSGFGKNLFAGWRILPDGSPNPELPLNDTAYHGGVILIAGVNFGCGSSREAAVWALNEYGFRCVIAASFGEIFYNNCFKNGMLPIILPKEQTERLAAQVSGSNAGATMTIDLMQQCIIAPDRARIDFTIDPARRDVLLEGLDEIGLTLKKEPQIAAFQEADRRKRPWVYR